ncbi:thiol-disulfide oxidoreductase DCC family protein [uncultured Flavobacterium sp.]|uniref:thiol-disulfide oxidoreductase DCC family protein n=1 Tax=uncultured Flavobacterium sp. TaxID=165435 RepID=UPI0025F683CD|nr:thiol-disulfide oxidoreductase DCC family protein [uncultured Flavobacterium sp.]
MELPKDKKIILFDGICNLCDATVQFIIKRDKKDVFRFVALQSALGQEIIGHIGLDISKTDSIILYEPGHAYYYKADAAIKIAKQLGGVFPLMGAFSILPKWLSNKVYDYVAKNRYKWYGKKNECMIPTPEMKAKFL